MSLLVDHSGKLFTKKRPTMKDIVANHEVWCVKDTDLNAHKLIAICLKSCWETGHDSLYTILCAMVLTYDPIRLSWRSSMGLMANPELAHIRYGMEYWLSSPNISCSLPESMPRFRLCKTGLWGMAWLWRSWPLGFMKVVSHRMGLGVRYLMQRSISTPVKT